MHLKKHGYKILIYISENLCQIEYWWVVEKLCRLSTSLFNNVSCVKIDPFLVEVSVCILYGPENIVIRLHIFSIISGDMTTTLTMKHNMRVIHMCNDPFTYSHTWDGGGSASNPMHPRPCDIYVCLHVFQVLRKTFLHECVVYIIPCRVNRIINDALGVSINGNCWLHNFNRFLNACF